MGRRLRLICSNDQILKERINEYTQYLINSGWNRKLASTELNRGASINRQEAMKSKRNKNNKKKIAWITTYDPRTPSKSKIIRDNLDILYSNPINRVIFPQSILIAADRRRKNIGEIYKPTIPRKQLASESNKEPGFYTCSKICDTCKHSEKRNAIKSKWDSRVWKIRDNITCTTKNVIYIMECNVHDNFMYVGSTVDLKKRWANHKSDSKNKHSKKCYVAKHYCELDHPVDNNVSCLKITPIEIVRHEKNMAARELFWQSNLGTFFTGGNERKDISKALKNRIQYQL